MPAGGKPRKPKAGFPPFPPSLESPQGQRPSHIPTASTAVLIYKELLSKAGLTAGPKTVTSEGGPKQTAEVGQNHLPNAARRRAWMTSRNLVLFLSDLDLQDLLAKRDADEDTSAALDSQMDEFFITLAP